MPQTPQKPQAPAPKPQPPQPSLWSKVCSALPFARVYGSIAAGGAASIYLGGGVTTLGLGPEIAAGATMSPAGPFILGGMAVLAGGTIACRAEGYGH